MAEWTRCVLEEYPNFNIVGEEWSLNPAITSYWQRGKHNADGYQCFLPSLMDFPLQRAVSEGLREDESWGSGLVKMYEMLANDFLYPDAANLVVFPDNHDMSRFFTQVGEEIDLLKMGVAYFLTTRGIPQILYGTEVLMSNPGTEDHGIIRSDFPGGWTGDRVNAFTGVGLSPEQTDMQNYLKVIQNWRKDQEVIHTGNMKHFAPQDGVYVYFRYNDDHAVMVVLNKAPEEKTISCDRFKEVTAGYHSGKEIITSSNIEDSYNFV